jgi:hypothetical protein
MGILGFVEGGFGEGRSGVVVRRKEDLRASISLLACAGCVFDPHESLNFLEKLLLVQRSFMGTVNQFHCVQFFRSN